MISPNLNGGFHTKKNYITVSQYGNKQQFIKLLYKLNLRMSSFNTTVVKSIVNIRIPNIKR